MDGVLADVRFALRWLGRSPAFAAVAIASLAVGIGVNTALFTVVDALLLRPLPVRDPGGLVEIYTAGGDGDRYATSSYPDYVDFRASNAVLEDVAGYSPMLAPLNLGDRSRLAIGELVTGNYFDMLGLRAARGRLLEPADDRLVADPVVVVSHRYWMGEMGGDPQAVGRTIRIRNRAYTVVGITPETFTGMVPMLSPEMWLPVARSIEVEPMGIQDTVPSPTGTNRLERRGQRWLFLKGRVKPGVTAAQVEASLRVTMAQLATAWPQTNRDRQISVKWSRDVRVHPAGDGLIAGVGAGLMGGVGLMLLVACANVASMLLARSTARQREIGIRLAIGASRGRIVRQLVTESLVLAGLGATAGLALAWWLTRLVSAFHVPLPIPIVLALRLDLRAVIFTAGATVVAALAAGLMPALGASRPGLAAELAGDAAGTPQTGRRVTLRDALVAGQVAVTLTLLVASALLTRSLLASQQARVGFDPDGIAVVSTQLGMAGYDEARASALFTDALARVRALPGVQQAALAGQWPFSINFSTHQVFVPDVQRPGDKTTPIQVTYVSPEYFETIGVPILQGRGFTDADTPQSPKVVVINETMARKYWPGPSPLGRQIRLRSSDGPTFEVVGVAANHNLRTVGESPAPYIHFSALQRPDNGYAVVARTRGDEAALVNDIRRILLELEPATVFIDQSTMRGQMAATLFPLTAGSWLVGTIGATAMVLAAIGLYGAIAYSVARRTREIGIRMAIGAGRGGVLWLVMRQGLRVALAGIAVGAVLAGGVAMALRSVLYGVTAADPLAWGAAIAVLFATAALANFIPARRAARVDPSIALRTE